jgi:hypothetical protein
MEVVMEQTALPIGATEVYGPYLRETAPRDGVIIGILTTREIFINGTELLHEESGLLLPHLSRQPYAWGHKGPGATRLALAILLKFVDRRTALRLYPDFEREVILSASSADQPLGLAVKRIKAWLGSKGVRV